MSWSRLHMARGPTNSIYVTLFTLLSTVRARVCGAAGLFCMQIDVYFTIRDSIFVDCYYYFHHHLSAIDQRDQSVLGFRGRRSKQPKRKKIKIETNRMENEQWELWLVGRKDRMKTKEREFFFHCKCFRSTNKEKKTAESRRAHAFFFLLIRDATSLWAFDLSSLSGPVDDWRSTNPGWTRSRNNKRHRFSFHFFPFSVSHSPTPFLFNFFPFLFPQIPHFKCLFARFLSRLLQIKNTQSIRNGCVRTRGSCVCDKRMIIILYGGIIPRDQDERDTNNT